MPSEVKRHPNAADFTWDEWAEGIRHYYALATMIDYEIGRMLDALADRGLDRNTIVIFSSDHGETLGSHGGLTDKGWNHFEEIQRVGLIVRDPREGGVPAGTVERRLVSQTDLYPTLLDLGGVDALAVDCHGRSLVPLLRGEDVPWRDTVFVEFGGVNSLATTSITCRHDRWKYGWNGSTLDELYDLEVDPHETINRIADPAAADVLQEMRRRMYSFMTETTHQARAMFAGTRMGCWGARQFIDTPDPISEEDLLIDLAW
jgi:arylsulfatase A-like enzyme